MTAASVRAAWPPVDSATRFVSDLRGWRRQAFTFVTGLLSALSFTPFGIFPLLLLSFAVLVLLLDGAQTERRPVWRSALIGWAYGFGQFLGGLYWVAYAFLVDPLQHGWQIPFVAMLFPGGLALFPALACALAAGLWRAGASRVFLLTATYMLAEWLRGHVLTGFPWNLPGYGWSASLAVLQSASWFGVYGLSLLAVLFGTSLALISEQGRARLLPAALTLTFIAIWLGGMARLHAIHFANVPGVRLRIVQPDVAQADKYVRALRAAHWRELIDLSGVGDGPASTHIIWPEAAPPFLLEQVPQAMADIATLTGADKVLMTGAARAEMKPDGKPLFHNSFYIFGHHGQLLATYDKFHLVPFGEYAPFPQTLHALGIDKLVALPGSFASGDGPHTYAVPGAPAAGPLICYEILFPGEVTGKPRPGWLVNVTDDSWFGPASSTGPYQHFLIARVRAIEEGLPVVRAANTGISGVIDPLGRVTAELGVDRVGVVDAGLPNALPPTFFARMRNIPFWLMFAACLIGAWAAPRRGN
jgi:apolipoprotein N-acyltransferase